MRKSQLVPVLLALSLVAASGCLGVGSTGADDGSNNELDSDMNPTEVTAAIIDANDSVGGYAYTTEQTMSGEDIATTVRAVVDRDGRRVSLQSNSTFMEQRSSYQLILGTERAYVKRSDADGWISPSVDQPDRVQWSQYDSLSHVVEMLERSDVSVAGPDTLNGTEVMVLQADVDGETYANVMVGANDSAGRDMASNVSGTLQVMVDKQRAYPLEAELQLSATNGGQDADSEEQRIVHKTFRFQQFGSAEKIQTPDETVTMTPERTSETTVVTVTAVTPDEP